MTLHSFLSRIVSNIKGEEFTLDDRIPLSYMLHFFMQKTLCLLIGIGKLHKFRKAFIHPSSKIKCPSKIVCGKNLNIDRNCYIDALSTEDITLGNNVSIGKYTTIECSGSLKSIGKGLTIGNNVGLGTHGFLGCAGGIEIGDDTIFGNYVSLHSENHNYLDINTPIRLQGVNRKGIIIGSNCWIGAKVTILDGTELGDGSIVAAGAVVRGKIPPYSIIGGIPAKIIKTRK
ncbi:MAG: acyltransferase [Bacteroides sp.]|uniref:acyltransferase n=1 Tax=Bacteroides sp. TaxID=29523 RepID=UPI0026E030E4|nr:acyltransferase [Bacteroides sp.]MDO5420574.1 acyltransferase [Bacteroides sp.]